MRRDGGNLDGFARVLVLCQFGGAKGIQKLDLLTEGTLYSPIICGTRKFHLPEKSVPHNPKISLVLKIF